MLGCFGIHCMIGVGLVLFAFVDLLLVVGIVCSLGMLFVLDWCVGWAFGLWLHFGFACYFLGFNLVKLN